MIDLPDPSDFLAFKEGTKEYKERQHRIQLWEDWDQLVCDFMVSHRMPQELRMEFRLDCFSLIKKYDRL